MQGQVVVVTGGTRGIGQAIATAFLEAGARVIATGTSTDDVAQRNARRDRPDTLHYDAVDLGDLASIEAFCARLRELPRVDALINNAGINQIATLSDIRMHDLERLMRIDLHAPFMLAQAVAGGMRSRRYGRIVNIASIWSVITKPGRAMYTAAKSGLAGFTRTLAVECAPDSVLVNTVSPGFTRTDLTAATNSPEEIERMAAQVPAQRLAEPSEIAAVIRFLAGPENTYLTGQNIVVDGGYSIV